MSATTTKTYGVPLTAVGDTPDADLIEQGRAKLELLSAKMNLVLDLASENLSVKRDSWGNANVWLHEPA